MTCRGMIVALVLTAFHGSAGFAQEVDASSVVKNQNADATAEQPKSEAAEGTTGGDDPKDLKDDSDLKEGHSLHGEVFNSGPRQAAYLMPGVGSVRFPVTSGHEEAKRFVEQGVAQLHGFWYFESERSFRQAAMLDPDCAIAYWGMAMSNRGNAKRAKGFIAEAVSRKEKTSRRERLLIEAFERFLNAKADKDDEKKRRANRYVTDLEDLLIEFPDDLETRAFLCEYFWSGKREGFEMASHLSVDAMIQQILDREPLHPAHHYRIHLWDGRKPALALESAALCGMSAPAIAHMWHMPGHIYSKLHRYHDAVYQQEASARVDHAHMMRDRVLPDQIHNFAHNNEWCIRNMIHIGRADDAERLAVNMISMPRHPQYNHIGKSGSYKYGRERLLDVLRDFERWERIAGLQGTALLEDTGNAEEDLRRDRAVGAAFAMVGRSEEAQSIRDSLSKTLDTVRTKQSEAAAEAEKKAREDKSDDKAVEKAKKDAEAKFAAEIKRFEKAIREIDGRRLLKSEQYAAALELLSDVDLPDFQLALLMLQAGKADEAVKKAGDAVRARKGEVLPLAAQTEILHAVGRKDEARTSFDQLRQLSSAIEMSARPFHRLAAVAAEFGFPEDWRIPATSPDDLGARPQLDALGPFEWAPVAAPLWTLQDVEGADRSLVSYRGRPVVVIFYLGYGCLHCAEQLKAVTEKFEGFQELGIDVVAVSTDQQVNLRRAWADLDTGFPFPLVADPEMTVFRQYRCYDDFEKAALHGTFLIDAEGLVRWQDISYDPFMDTDFLLKESRRLIGSHSVDAAQATIAERPQQNGPSATR